MIIFKFKNETGLPNEEILKYLSDSMGGAKVETLENDFILNDGEYITFRTLRSSNDFIDMVLRQDICGDVKLFGTITDIVPEDGTITFDEEPEFAHESGTF